MEDTIEPKLQPHRLLASFLLGISLTLLMTTPSGSAGTHAVSPGWVGLWLVTTLGCTPLGAMLLLRKPWRGMPIDLRRGPAMAYLTSVGINLLALAVLVTAFEGAGPAICLPIFAALGLALLYLRLYAALPEKSEDLFP